MASPAPQSVLSTCCALGDTLSENTKVNKENAAPTLPGLRVQRKALKSRKNPLVSEGRCTGCSKVWTGLDFQLGMRSAGPAINRRDFSAKNKQKTTIGAKALKQEGVGCVQGWKERPQGASTQGQGLVSRREATAGTLVHRFSTVCEQTDRRCTFHHLLSRVHVLPTFPKVKKVLSLGWRG